MTQQPRRKLTVTAVRVLRQIVTNPTGRSAPGELVMTAGGSWGSLFEILKYLENRRYIAVEESRYATPRRAGRDLLKTAVYRDMA